MSGFAHSSASVEHGDHARDAKVGDYVLVGFSLVPSDGLERLRETTTGPFWRLNR